MYIVVRARACRQTLGTNPLSSAPPPLASLEQEGATGDQQVGRCGIRSEPKAHAAHKQQYEKPKPYTLKSLFFRVSGWRRPRFAHSRRLYLTTADRIWIRCTNPR